MTLPSTDTTLRPLLNSGVVRLHPSATLAINEKVARLRDEGRRIYHLGFGQSPFPIPEPVVAALKANAFRKAYLPVKGLPELREAVAHYHRRLDGLAITADDVLIGPGTKQLIFLLQLTYGADLVIPSPSWVSYEPQAALLGRQVRWVDTRDSGWRMTAGSLEGVCAEDPSRARLLILNYPGNPTGLALGAVELEAIARVARKYGVLILADEIYGELNHAGTHVSIARYYPEGTIVSSGLSKWCSAGGWRVGSLCFPRALSWLLDAMAVVASETYSAVSAPIQYAAVTAYQPTHEIERYVFQSRRILGALARLVRDRLHANRLDVFPPEGGYYLFVDFTPYAEALGRGQVLTSPQLCDRLLDDTGVALLPGVDFGRPATELTCRLAYVDFNGAECLEAAAGIPDSGELSEAFLRKYCPNVLAAVDAIAAWLHQIDAAQESDLA